MFIGFWEHWVPEEAISDQVLSADAALSSKSLYSDPGKVAKADEFICGITKAKIRTATATGSLYFPHRHHYR